ncbi:hypothetical protein [Actinobaculum sp. 352]|uniref:hypothetical protein n=1 Tax=Actinobaculum sp. 352 TaxID=2490946 RepID=UPI000F7D7C59|nr:hypothetical protein [Actinobaculum sp. 352]RTE48033.1 hypothetical protein EKN07_11210 [Actinobaculum sp. 352]
MAGSLLAACADFSERYYGRTDEYLPAREVPYAEARREAILLLMRLQQTLSDEFGVGEWAPPPLGGVSQVDTSDSGCPSGGDGPGTLGLGDGGPAHGGDVAAGGGPVCGDPHAVGVWWSGGHDGAGGGSYGGVF